MKIYLMFSLLVLMSLTSKVNLASAETVFCYAQQTGVGESTLGYANMPIVIRKSVELNLSHSTALLGKVNGVRYSVSIDPFGSLTSTILKNGSESRAQGSKDSTVAAMTVSGTKKTNWLECTANYNAASSYHITRCENVTADCINN